MVFSTSQVLGKRSATELPSTSQSGKRITQRSAPQIYQDAEDVVAHSSRSGARSCRQYSRPHLKQQRASKVVPAADQLLAQEQDENVPPADVEICTPSATRFKNVLETSPSTPKHRVRVLGGLLTPQTPRIYSPSSNQTDNVYTQARQLFAQSSYSAKLIGRDQEKQHLREILRQAESQQQGSCTYISGPPGTGKSALIHEVLEDFQHEGAYCISVVNCSGLKSAAQVYEKLATDLLPASTSKTPLEARLKRLFTTKRSENTSYVVILDEIDSLADSDCEILYNIFECALLPSSSLTLIGIANALDLTDRFLPRLKSRGLKPRLLPFLPYTAQQISEIITQRLKSLLSKEKSSSADFVPVIHPAAIQLCGKKIASQTGDLRKAFSLVRRAIDAVEKDSHQASIQSSPTKTVLGEIGNTRTILTPSKLTASRALSTFTVENAPRATISHMARLAASIFNNHATTRLAGLNLQQKAVLCSIINKESRRMNRDPYLTPSKTINKAPTVGELFMLYTSLCKRDDGVLQPLKDTEFRDVVASLETLGLVHESKARSSGFSTPATSSRGGRMTNEQAIASIVTEKEMRDSLKGPGAGLLDRLLDES